MRPYSGGIRHDYKDAIVDSPATPKRHWSWFIVGLALPLCAVSLFLVVGTDEPRVVQEPGYPPQAVGTPVSLNLPQALVATETEADGSTELDRANWLDPVAQQAKPDLAQDSGS